MLFRVELLPAEPLEVDACAVDRLEEERLLVELERLAGEHVAGSAQVEHERVVAGVAAHVEHALAADVRHVVGEAMPALVVSPGAADHEIAAEQEWALEPRLQLLGARGQPLALVVRQLGRQVW